MALKTFNVEEKSYKKFSEFCKGHGISMSKQVDLFMKFFISEGSEAKEMLERIKRLKGL